MRIANRDDGELEVDWLTVELRKYEHITITLPSGHRIDVFEDFINVAAPNTSRHEDGVLVWNTPRTP